MYGASAITLAFLMLGQPLQQQQSVPDAPSSGTVDAPSQPAPSLSDLKNQVAPGKATTPDSNGDTTGAAQPAQAAPPTQAGQPVGDAPLSDSARGAAQDGQQEAPEIPGPGQAAYRLPTVNVNFVLVPVTVRDSKHKLVAGLTWRDFKVYENGVPQHISWFTVDPLPLSVALVIDQSVPADTMKKVNDSLAAITGAFAPYDEVALFTYNKFVEQPTAFTAAQGARLPAVVARIKAPGRDIGTGYSEGPLANGPIINGQQVDPNLSMQRGNSSTSLIIPKEYHPLNDAV